MIIVYENAARFLDALQPALLEREAVSQLLLANAIGAGERPCEPDCLFGTVKLEGEPVLAFCNCAPWNLIIHSVRAVDGKAPDGVARGKLMEASGELAAFLGEKDVPIKGINANAVISEGFLARYDTKGRTVRKCLSMDIMECRALKDIAQQKGIYRPAAKEDLDWILEGCMAFEKEALGKRADREELKENIINHQIGENRLRLFALPDGTPVAMANRTRNLKHGFVINQVYTLPAYRGMGYAQTLIHKMCEEFFREGYGFATLFVDKTNPVSNRVYEKVGFEILEDNYDYRFIK